MTDIETRLETAWQNVWLAKQFPTAKSEGLTESQKMGLVIDSQDRDETALLCENREYAISVASIQTVLTQDGDIEKRCIDPMAMARLGRLQRRHRDKNRCYIETGFELVDGITY